MKSTRSVFFSAIFLIGIPLIFSSFYNRHGAADVPSFPYEQAGLTKQQAAAHLLSRFTFGATPGQVDAVASQGLERWFSEQLEAKLPDDSLNKVLEKFDGLRLSNEEVINKYPNVHLVDQLAVKSGIVIKDSTRTNRQVYKKILADFMAKNDLRQQKELYRDLINQKVLKASYSHNQLQEVMTSFWFNHFNVSLSKNTCAQYVPNYERDVIRPNALGRFNDILLATAKSPAMLYYLDNSSSSAAVTPKPAMMAAATDSGASMTKGKVAQQRGLNENYAREVMELHTLGVDGGYTQQDVTEAAKILTGWGVYPMGNYEKASTIAAKATAQRLEGKGGMVHDGDFLFTPKRHDNSTKTVMGKKFEPAGYDEGVQFLSMLAHHQSTARFISRKLAVRFVSDTPPQTLIDKMAKTFLSTDGDIKQVLISMVSSPEFWAPSSLRQKTKSPFELVINTVRSLQAQVVQPYQLYAWINRMGEKAYFYQAPTGFPDRGQFWINTGALLNRMNFGLAFASGRIPGVTFDLLKLNHNHEPESAQAALVAYGGIIMPGRQLDKTIKQLTPMLNDPELMIKVDNASSKTAPKVNDALSTVEDATDPDKKAVAQVMVPASTPRSMMGQVVGIIVGSPEYQRR
jgi:uncharacterized protein (DUF1800 family)